MRQRTIREEDLYQCYVILGKELATNHHLDKQMCWELVTNKGIFKFPILNQYGGSDLTWRESCVAMEGLAKNYSDFDFFSSLITQLDAIYLVNRYAKAAVKKQYLPRMIQGERVSILIPEFPHQFLKNDNVNIIIQTKKTKNNITFYIYEKNVVKNKLVSGSKGFAALCDFINFKKILYGILAANRALPMFKKHKETIQNNPILAYQAIYEQTEENIYQSQKTLYSLFDQIK